MFVQQLADVLLDLVVFNARFARGGYHGVVSIENLGVRDVIAVTRKNPAQRSESGCDSEWGFFFRKLFGGADKGPGIRWTACHQVDRHAVKTGVFGGSKPFPFSTRLAGHEITQDIGSSLVRIFPGNGPKRVQVRRALVRLNTQAMYNCSGCRSESVWVPKVLGIAPNL
jgi:hypothetical protein